MAGYSRQSAADIIANAIIKAAPVNAEYNALRDAFAFSGGHKHDGSSTEGAHIPLIADTDALNKVVIDTTNNRIGFFTEVSSSAVEQLRIQDGAIVPVTDDDIDIGSSSLKFKDLYVDGVGNIDSVVVTGAATFSNIDINGGAIDGATIGAASAGAATFTDLTATGTTTVTTADVNGGNIDGTIIGASTAAAGTFTDLTTTGTSTHATVDINGGNVDGTTIGASSAAAASFTTVSTSGQATLATVDINGGAIDGTIIGANSAAAITGTTITASSGFVGDLTGNITGDIDGDITGNITGNVTGNVTANSGTSTFANVTVNGTLDVTGTTIANVTDPSNAQDAATKNYVDTEVSALVDSAPGTLNTLNELAAALGDDASFSTTVTNSIAAKLPLAGGTMSGAIAMGTSKITGLGDPTADQDAATKKYTTDTFLPLAGGTLTGAVAAGNNKITATYTPSANSDLTTKTYVDSIAGSGTAAATSATAAASSATAAASSATAAASSATAAASSATSAAASFDSFDDRYLGAKSSAPSTDNDGDALQVGTLYFNTTSNSMQVYGGSGFTAAGSSVNGTTSRQTYTATSGQTTFSITYDAGFVDVYLNGVKLLLGTDFTATSGTAVVLASGATAGDIVDIVAYGTFTLATHYTKTEADALLAAKQPYHTIAVTVQNVGGANKYFLDGTQQQTALLQKSVTIRFDQSDSSNSNHPLRLSETSNGTHGGGSAFTTGVTAVGTPGSAGAYTQVTLEQDAPDVLYYYCTNHSAMGATVYSGKDFSTLTSTVAELNILDGVTSTAAELNILDGVTATATELNYVDGVTSNVQTQLDAKLPLSGGTLTGAITGTTATFTTSDNSAQLNLTSTDTDANNGPRLVLQRNSSSPADNDVLGQIEWYGENDASEAIEQAKITVTAIDVTDGSEDSALNITTKINSSTKSRIYMPPTETVFNEESVDVDFRVESNGNANMLFVDGGNDRVGIGTSSPNATLTLSDGTDEFDFGVTTNLLMIKTVTSDGSDDQRIILDAGNGGQSSSRGAYIALSGNEASSNGGQAIYQMGNVSGASHEFRKAGGTYAASIDSSGNLLVGSTNTAPASNNVDGVSLRVNNSSQFSRSNDPAFAVNRKGNDGGLATFMKDGSTVGSIGVSGGNNLYISGEATNHSGLTFATDSVLPTRQGTITDNITDLGQNGNAFKDAYFSGTVIAGGATIDGTLDIEEVFEKVLVNTNTGFSLFSFDILSQGVYFLTANQDQNRTINFRGDASTSLNSVLAVGQSVTCAVLATQGSTAYYLNAYQVDGSSVTPKWSGGSAPSAGNASSIDAYSFTIIKTANATFTVLASVTQFA